MLAPIILGFSAFLFGAAAAGVLSLAMSWLLDRLPPVTDEDVARLMESLRG